MIMFIVIIIIIIITVMYVYIMRVHIFNTLVKPGRIIPYNYKSNKMKVLCLKTTLVCLTTCAMLKFGSAL